MTKYIVRCAVSGGVTGSRESILKANGVVRYFETPEEAAAEASRLNAARSNSYSASFRYWAVEIEVF